MGGNSKESVKIIDLRRSKQPRVEKNFGDDFYGFLVEDDPITFSQTMATSGASLWK